jgi:hypothetical protein
MAYTADTHTISFDLPVPEGIIKELQESEPWDADIAQDTSDITLLEQEAETIPLRPTFIPHKPLGFSEWLATGAAKLSRTIVTTFAATQLNLARMSSDPQLTEAFDATAIIRAISEEKASVVALSEELIGPRTEVQASSFIRPSGAYLTWIGMLGEPFPDEG